MGDAGSYLRYSFYLFHFLYNLLHYYLRDIPCRYDDFPWTPLKYQDYMLIDPFLQHGITEFHDRHRGMRLDVDNMSYEVKRGYTVLSSLNNVTLCYFSWLQLELQELLALEERIGDVSTGLSEDNIVKLMKQRIYTSVMTESPSDLEPCCICQVWVMADSASKCKERTWKQILTAFYLFFDDVRNNMLMEIMLVR